MARQHPQPQRQAGSAPCFGRAIGLLMASTGLIQAALAAPSQPFPSQDSLRQLQLAALACARDNTAASCDPVARMADPLLDHPRLPAACKDQLWALSQRARVSAVNSYGRRESIAQPAQLLLLSCRSGEKPKPTAQPAGQAGTTPQFSEGNR